MFPISRVTGTLLILLLLCASGEAKERLFRLFDQRDGLPVSEVVRLAQDEDGFIWIGTFGGLVRYDGYEMRPWTSEELNGRIHILIVGSENQVIAGVESGSLPESSRSALFRVQAQGVQSIPGPEGSPLGDIHDAEFLGDGSLCLVRSERLLCRSSTSQWSQYEFIGGRREEVQRVRRGLEGSLLVITDGGLWRLDKGRRKQKLLTLPGLLNVLEHPNGSLYLTTFGFPDTYTGRLLRAREGDLTTVVEFQQRPLHLALRGDVLWASFTRYLVAVRPGESPEVLGPEEDLPSGGPLLVDHEGSLWVGTFRGLMHFPEPDTAVWNDQDGLPSPSTRFLLQVGQDMWVGTWEGLGRLVRSGGKWQARAEPVRHIAPLCADAAGRLWLVENEKGFAEFRRGGYKWHPDPEADGRLGCASRPDGTVWLYSNRGLFRTLRTGGPPDSLASGPPEPLPPVGFRRALEDSQGRLWLSAGEQICRAPAAAVAREEEVRWRCQHIENALGVSALAEIDGGHIWAATFRAGLWRFDGNEWVVVPGTRHLPSNSIRGLVSSPRGGVWILGHGVKMRVHPRLELPDGWEVVENLSNLMGIPGGPAEDLLEEEDGSLWLATINGLVQVPARAREVALPPPKVRLINLVVNGSPIPPQPPPELTHQQNMVELRFAALSYRDRSLLRYQVRLRPDAPWTESIGDPPVFRFADLPAGTYAAEVRASLDGQNWSRETAQVSFKILPPWYLQTWALALFVLLIGSLLYIGHHHLLRMLLRLERQRTRLAMDLHDEIGSGLGSIRILTSLVEDPSQPRATRANAIKDISETAEELGTALGEMVWSLRPRSATLEALASHLTERAAKLFPGETPLFAAQIPEPLPHVPLSLAVRRNVALIALEALHNAARHAQATHVVLGLAPERRRWKLWVSDDGRGLTGEAQAGGEGLGLTSMRRRAEEIRATLRCSPNSTSGITISLVFDSQAVGFEDAGSPEWQGDNSHHNVRDDREKFH